MKVNVFSYLAYVDFIKEMIKSHKSVYGYKAALADSAVCQRSYLSQVLAGSSHLTVEHAANLSDFFEFNDLEQEYFLNLILLARAATSLKLKSILEKKIFQMQQDQENILNRIVEKKEVLSDEAAAIFYSNWSYLAVLIATTIEDLRTVKKLAARLNLKEAYIEKLVVDLQRLGLLKNVSGAWVATNNTIHLPKNSPFNSLNHTNWRQLATQNSFIDQPGSVHYTSVCSLSKNDAEKIKSLMLQLIDDGRKIISPSKEEVLYCLTCDWFQV